jgi:activator of 2-hydroxyglutaryl-CoA dehydratase
MVTNFTVSEKCAAGVGCFIEVIANVLRIDLSDFGPLTARSRTPITFGTGYAVFDESEAIIRVSELNTSLQVPPHPPLITALGAAITTATSATPESSKKKH